MSRIKKQFLPLEDYLPAVAGEGWRRTLRSALERFLGLAEIRRRSDLMEKRLERGENAFQVLFDVMEFDLDAPGVRESIPAEGPVVVIANHPHGGPEAVALSLLATLARPDTIVLGNAEAINLPGLAKWILPLEILGGEGATRKNLGMLKQSLVHLRNGGTVVVFPAGAVSHWQWETARVEDPPWPLHTARLVSKSGAKVLPVRIFGQNGPIFQILGMFHPLLRSALIPRASLAMRRRAVRCRAGALLDPSDLPDDPREMTVAMREAVYGVLSGDGN